MDIETHNLSAELALWQRHDEAGQRDQFEAAATHGYSEEAIEVFTHRRHRRRHPRPPADGRNDGNA